VDRIFNVSSEIFWLMIKYMRADFKVRLTHRIKDEITYTDDRKKSRCF
jgi:Sec7-like guanine-nucleotide exchange factor